MTRDSAAYVLTRRLALIEGKLRADAYAPKEEQRLRDEGEALRFALVELGLFDAELLEKKITRVNESVIPALRRRHEQVQNFRTLVDKARGQTGT